MTNKLVFIIPAVLSALLLGATLLSGNQANLQASQDIANFEDPNSSPVETESQCGCNATTFFSWSTCYGRLGPNRECKYAGNPLTSDGVSQIKLCNKASQAVEALIHPDEKNETCACRQFWNFFEVADAYDNLNTANLYWQCFTDAKVINAAKISSFYYNSIYAPKFLSCANTRVY